MDFFALPTVGYILKHDYRSDQCALVIPNGRTSVLGGEAGAVFTPEDFGVTAMYLAVFIGPINGTFFFWIHASISLSVMPE